MVSIVGGLLHHHTMPYDGRVLYAYRVPLAHPFAFVGSRRTRLHLDHIWLHFAFRI